jgi:hypothetical protein
MPSLTINFPTRNSGRIVLEKATFTRRGGVLAQRREPGTGSRRPFSSPCDFQIL